MFDIIDYDIIKVIHILAIISWMAGLLYLPRLFVYHADAKKGSSLSETLKIMERRLFKAIIRPAMVVSWLAGLYMAFAASWGSDGWFHAKITFVILLSAYSDILGRWLKAFANDENKKSAKYFRYANEIPTVLMILIVVMVIIKPF